VIISLSSTFPYPCLIDEFRDSQAVLVMTDGAGLNDRGAIGVPIGMMCLKEKRQD
jgi:hypothetical protein